MKADAAVTTMRSGTDHEVLRALLDLAGEPPTAVIELLVDRVDQHGPSDVRAGAAPESRSPDGGTIARVFELVQRGDARGLLACGGGTYDGMVALLVATLAVVDDPAADPTGPPS